MAGENPEDEPRPAQPDEFLSKTKWERFQVLIMGPVMNLLLAVVADGGRAVSGRRSAGVTRISRSSSAPSTAGSPAEQAGIQPGDRIVSVADQPRRHLGAVLHRGRHAAEPRGRRSACCATAWTSRASVTPVVADGQSRFEIGDIGVLPNVHPHVRSVTPGEPAERGGPQGRRRHRWRSTASRSRSTRSCAKRSPSIPDKPITLSDPARRRSRMTLTVTPGKHGDGRAGSASLHRRRHAAASSRGSVEARQDERRRRTSRWPG